MGTFEVSFNSPQCGWMSIGFTGAAGEFHSTTAHSPYENVLEELLGVLIAMTEEDAVERVVRWNRDPEEFDLHFVKSGAEVLLEIFEYPTAERVTDERELKFSHRGDAAEVCRAFYDTFAQLYEDRETDEFEFNWRRPFPFADFEKFEAKMTSM